MNLDIAMLGLLFVQSTQTIYGISKGLIAGNFPKFQQKPGYPVFGNIFLHELVNFFHGIV